MPSYPPVQGVKMKELDLTDLNEEDLKHFLRDLFLYMAEERGFSFATRISNDVAQYVQDLQIARRENGR